MKTFAIRDRKGKLRIRGAAEDPEYWFRVAVEGAGGSRGDHLQAHEEPGGKVLLHQGTGLRMTVAT